MNRVRAVSILFLLVLGVSPGVASPEATTNLGPAEVVELQLQAFQDNDEDDNGIALAWEFNSPANQRANGSLDRFIGVIHQSFPDMLGSRSFELGEPQIEDDLASVPVRILCKHGREHGFIFWLSQQHPAELAGQWLTEGVTPIALPEREPEPLREAI